MDIVAHMLWAAAGAVASRRKLQTRINVGWAAAYAALPDIVPFTGPVIIKIGRIISGAATSMLPDGRGPRFEWVTDVYGATHSILLFGIVFAAVWSWRKRPPLEMFGWALHIVIDVPTHTGYFAVRYLWPISSATVDGIRWETPWLLAANYAALLVAGFWLWLQGRNKLVPPGV